MNEKVKLVKTCGACPEQYDAYIDGECLGYLRLRHGYFKVEYRGGLIFCGNPRGDGLFEYEERDNWLNKACAALLQAHKNNKEEIKDLLFEIEDDDQCTCS